MVAIVWTDKADEDMEQIIDYWASISENSARLQIKRFFDMVDILETFPRSGRVVPEFGHPQMREHIAGHYRIFIMSFQSQELIFLLSTIPPARWM
ncbi:MAG TPA: type II toxin-antitoxin system RelE/ParE family toxin [Saprospiraceae bacterium]|nr:type II toxin-antitoxin system RelE/ParE family toxin [Saprospiraceae bacterium]